MAVVEAFAYAGKTATTLTISSGVVTVTQMVHVIAAETGTTDDLETITDGITGQTSAGLAVLLLIADTGDTITLKHGTDNLDLPGDADIDLDDDHWIMLLWSGSNWQLVGDYL